MSREKLVRVEDSQGEAYIFWCPGCSMDHIVPVRYSEGHGLRNGKPKPTWHFNGSMEHPTFKPYVAVEWVGTEPPQRCHCLIKDGELIYLVGSTHGLSGKRMKMEARE